MKKVFLLIWKAVIWIVWDFSGVRYIWTKIKPPFNKDEKLSTYRRPATFFLWLVGIYVALFGIASNRYENRADKIENRMNAIYAQIPKDMKVAFSRIDDVQNMLCPYKPNIFQPVSIIKSFKFVVTSDEYQKLIEEKKSSKIATWFFKHFYLVDIKYDDGIEQLKQLVEDWAQRTKLIKGKKVGELDGFDLKGVHLEKAELSKANLEDANLRGANLKNADLGKANLENALFYGASLKNAKNLTAKQLSRVFSLWRVKNLNPRLAKKVKKINPKLFKPNYEVYECNDKEKGLLWREYLKKQKK